MFKSCMNKCTPPDIILTKDTVHHTIYDCLRVCGGKFKETMKLINYPCPEEFSHDISQ